MKAFHRVGEVETDERRRASLGKLVEPNTKYAVEKNEDGVLRLVPLLSMTKEQLDAALTQAIKHAQSGESVRVEDVEALIKGL